MTKFGYPVAGLDLLDYYQFMIILLFNIHFVPYFMILSKTLVFNKVHILNNILHQIIEEVKPREKVINSLPYRKDTETFT